MNRSIWLLVSWFAVPAWAAQINLPAALPAADAETAGGGDRQGIIVPINISTMTSLSLLGVAGNSVLPFNLAVAMGLPNGTPVQVTGVGWNVKLETFGGSWFSDAGINFNDPPQSQSGFSIHPAAGNSGSGGPAIFTQSTIKLSNVGIPNLVLSTGNLRLEFFETFDDVTTGNMVDAQFGGTVRGEQSILYVQATPEPASATLLALALAAVASRRRQ